MAGVRLYIVMWRTDEAWNMEYIQAENAQSAVDFARQYCIFDDNAIITDVAQVRKNWK